MEKLIGHPSVVLTILRSWALNKHWVLLVSRFANVLVILSGLPPDAHQIISRVGRGLIRPAKLVRPAVEKMAWHGRLVPVFPAVRNLK